MRKRERRRNENCDGMRMRMWMGMSGRINRKGQVTCQYTVGHCNLFPPPQCDCFFSLALANQLDKERGKRKSETRGKEKEREEKSLVKYILYLLYLIHWQFHFSPCSSSSSSSSCCCCRERVIARATGTMGK